VKEMLENVIKEINHYRQMDTHGVPVDLSLVFKLLVVAAIYVFLCYRMTRKKGKGV
jgi:hypothetical protein